jgi:hypothetical protein
MIEVDEAEAEQQAEVTLEAEEEVDSKVTSPRLQVSSNSK